MDTMYHEIVDVAYSNSQSFMEHKALIATLLLASGLAEIVCKETKWNYLSSIYKSMSDSFYGN